MGMGNVISQLVPVLAMKDFKDMIVQVIFIDSIEIAIKITDYVSFTELTCPSDCSNAGMCNTTTGQCSCDLGRHDLDCSSKMISKFIKECTTVGPFTK